MLTIPISRTYKRPTNEFNHAFVLAQIAPRLAEIQSKVSHPNINMIKVINVAHGKKSKYVF